MIVDRFPGGSGIIDEALAPAEEEAAGLRIPGMTLERKSSSFPVQDMGFLTLNPELAAI